MGFSHPEYTVIKELGRGASGVVYLAVQKQLNRRVAIKVIEDPLALPATRQRFLREARILAQLDHPHILPVYELSELADQPGYLLAMAYIEGGTLRQRAAVLTLSQALLVVQQIADALGFAHKAGFVHRDVKPDNILFQHDQAMLADFGIARPTESQTQMTQLGTILGTPTYISPEQVNGGVVDARSDLYCLGIVLYELLAGRPPFRGDSAIATGMQHLTAKVPELPLVFEPYQAFIDRVLAKDKNDRQTDADEFMAELRLATERLPLPLDQRLTDLRAKVAYPEIQLAGIDRSVQSTRKRNLALVSGTIAVGSVVAVAGIWFLPSTKLDDNSASGVSTDVQEQTRLTEAKEPANADPAMTAITTTVPFTQVLENPVEMASGESNKEPGTAARIVVSDIETGAPETAREQDPFAEQLATARSLWLDGSWFDGDKNAADQYQAILLSDPQRKEAIHALQDMLDKTLEKAEQELQDQQFDNVAATLSQLRNYWPGNSRVSALNSQLQSAREHKRESERKLAERRARQQARLQRVEAMLEKASAAEYANNLIEPENDNAFYYYQTVLADDPDNTQAKDAITKIKETLLERIALDAASENIASSEQQLAKLETLYPDDSSIAMVRVMLQNKKNVADQQRARQEQLAAEAQKLEASRQTGDSSGSDDTFRIPGF